MLQRPPLPRMLAPVLLLLALPGAMTGQVDGVVLSGGVMDASTQAPLPYLTVTLHDPRDSSLIAGTLSGENGRWTMEHLRPGDHELRIGGVGYAAHRQRIHVGSLSAYLELGVIAMRPGAVQLGEFEVVQHVDEVRDAMDRKVFRMDNNSSQSGGTVLQALRNLPGVTVDQRNGKLQLRGSDKVAVLVDGQQTALTGFGDQSGLDNIPASAIERIEVINDPSAKQDANGMAGIINIVYRKDKREGLHGKIGMMAGLGALGEKQADLPMVRPQYALTPKLGPSLGLNWNRKGMTLHLQADLLHQQVLNRDEHFTRTFDDGASVRQQYLENRDQTSYTTKLGSDITLNERNTLSLSGLFGREAHIDHGDVIYFDGATAERQRLWRFYEDEVNTSANFATAYTHTYAQPGRRLDIGLNYTFHREDEVYDITDNTPAGIGYNNTALIADEHVGDVKVDYIRPTKHGRCEAGGKFRWRNIPTRIAYTAGPGSPLDPGAAGSATYNELIPALYATYVFEREKDELEAGLRVEHVTLNYTVDPGHNTYGSDGYSYLQPFPNLRYARKVGDRSRVSASLSRRADRPDEGDLRIFPKYDDPTILRIGNPGLRPQFTLRGELGYKLEFARGYFYGAAYHRITDAILTRIVTGDGSTPQLYTLAQNAGRGSNTGVEVVIERSLLKSVRLSVNGNIYQNTIDAFSTVSAYPVPTPYAAPRQRTTSGNAKLNARAEVRKGLDVQLTGIWQARDLVPQGSIGPRWSLDLGVVRKFPGLRSDLTIAATDLFNTYRIPKVVVGDGFKLVSTDYLESRALRVTWAWNF